MGLGAKKSSNIRRGEGKTSAFQTTHDIVKIDCSIYLYEQY